MGLVWIMYSLHAPDSDVEYLMETKADSKMKAYRGGCTDQYWSNTTACPDWCSNSKQDAYSAILTYRLSRRFSRKGY